MLDYTCEQHWIINQDVSTSELPRSSNGGSSAVHDPILDALSEQEMAFVRCILVFYVLLLHGFFASVFGESVSSEEFSEELLLKPLPDRKVLAHFHFESTAPPTRTYGHHHRLFPKAIYQLVHKFQIREMELSFTQGRWNYERWGGFDPMSSGNAKPPGVELWASFDVPPDQVDAIWKNLTHALSGLFCASINFLESSTAYGAPHWGFRPFSGSHLRYGALPREAVCTENLTPWLKLLPCRDKAGLAAIMDRRSIYRGFYHSQRLRLLSSEFSTEGVDTGIILEQTLTVVLQPVAQKASTYSAGSLVQPSWSMSSIFGRRVGGKCVLAKSSNVFLELERDIISEVKKLQTENGRFGDDDTFFQGSWSNPVFELSLAPDRIIKEGKGFHSEISSILYEFSIEKYNDFTPFDVGLTWKLPTVWSPPQAPLRANRFLMGSGNERGSIAISLESVETGKGFFATNIIGDKCRVRVDVFQIVPWYVKVYFHTLQVFIDGQPQIITDVIEKMRVSPSEDKVSPGVMEMVLKLPCSVKSAALTIEFDKGFLHIDEYPPDANQGFDIPSAVISYPDFLSSMNFHENNTSNNSPMLVKFQESSPVISYTEVLLVPLTTPDFSMPYNVITITCTVFALYFGSLLNVLRRRVGEEERYLKGKDAKKPGIVPQLLHKFSAKLRGRSQEPQSSLPSSSLLSTKLIFKVVLVAGVAVAWHYYFG